MRAIRCLKDFELTKINAKFLDYLKKEFHGLYEYLNNGESLEDFQLPSYQGIIVLNRKELFGLLSSRSDIEFLEVETYEGYKIIRLGIMIFQDVQLHYYGED